MQPASTRVRCARHWLSPRAGDAGPGKFCDSVDLTWRDLSNLWWRVGEPHEADGWWEGGHSHARPQGRFGDGVSSLTQVVGGGRNIVLVSLGTLRPAGSLVGQHEEYLRSEAALLGLHTLWFLAGMLPRLGTKPLCSHKTQIQGPALRQPHIECFTLFCPKMSTKTMVQGG